MIYRAEIDGMRALAVVPVILFHAGFDVFSGGYVGVDVFFVISGYLITTIILDELEEGRFSIADFYERRARRILPALFFVMLASLPFAWMWLPPVAMKDFSQSLVAVSMFSSNILFWLESGYFDTAAELKPLLHTWSLAAEEQYYILFPVFLMLTWRLGLKWILVLLSLVFVVSLGAAHWATNNAFHPKIISGAFFLLPTRGWELLVGVFVAFYLKHNTYLKSSKANELLSLIGFGMIVYSIVAFDQSTPFPSLYALVPTVGTGLVILSAVPNTIVHRLLSFSPIVGIGLISYSAYLWHQPVLAFGRHSPWGENLGDIAPMLVLLAFTLAWFSWKFVEKPWRNSKDSSRKAVIGLSVVASILFMTIGYVGHVKKGFSHTGDAKNVLVEPILSEDIFVIGDSHAEHLVAGLSRLTTGKIIERVGAGCIPFLNVDRYDSRFVPGNCAKVMNESLHEFATNKDQRIIILSALGAVYLEGTPFRGKDRARVIGLGVELVDNPLITDRWQVFEIGMRNTFRFLTELDNRRVFFVIDIPELGIDYGCAKDRNQIDLFGSVISDSDEGDPLECKIPRIEYDERAERYKNLVYSIADEFPSVTIFDPTSLFCDQNYCYGFNDEFGYLYEDIDHLSTNGSIFVAQKLVEVISSIKE